MTSLEFWPAFAGIAILVLGLAHVRREWVAARGWDRLIVLGPVFVASPLAAFGAEHLVLGRTMAPMVPSWIPAHVFWIYFVGLGLLAAAVSLALGKCVRWSALLLALLFLIFVATMDLPGAHAHSTDRFAWILALREVSFGAGALALAGMSLRGQSVRASKAMIGVARVCLAGAVIFYAIEHFLHPEHVLGVPLEKLMPTWVPLHELWAWLVGAILLVAGAGMLLRRWSRSSAALVGAVMVVLTLALYLPIWLMARGGAQVLEGLNYVFDTLLFGGSVLLLAMATENEIQRSSP